MGRNGPDEGFGAENESLVSLYGPWRRKSPKVPSVKNWWWMEQEGGKVHPTLVDARRARCTVCASSVERSGWQWRVGRGGKRAHPNRYPVLNGRILYVVGEEAVEGYDAWLERPRTRPRGFKEPRNKMTQTRKRGAVEW